MFDNYLATVNPDTITAGLRERSFVRLPVRLTTSECAVVRNFVDAVPADRCELNYGGTEKRIWDAHLASPLVEQFKCFSDLILERVFGHPAKARTVLAYSNRPLPSGGDFDLGRWHLDSLRRQIKVFAFLSGVTEKSGPLELITGSQTAAFKTRALLKGALLSPSDIFNRTRSYQKLDDRRVHSLTGKQHVATPLLCDAGTIFVVDTSALHRARPCREGERYALTTYYDHF